MSKQAGKKSILLGVSAASDLKELRAAALEYRRSRSRNAPYVFLQVAYKVDCRGALKEMSEVESRFYQDSPVFRHDYRTTSLEC